MPHQGGEKRCARQQSVPSSAMPGMGGEGAPGIRLPSPRELPGLHRWSTAPTGRALKSLTPAGRLARRQPTHSRHLLTVSEHPPVFVPSHSCLLPPPRSPPPPPPLRHLFHPARPPSSPVPSLTLTLPIPLTFFTRLFLSARHGGSRIPFLRRCGPWLGGGGAGRRPAHPPRADYGSAVAARSGCARHDGHHDNKRGRFIRSFAIKLTLP